MYNLKIKNQAKKLRKKGQTVRDIATNLGVSFSTVSFWCRDIKLSESVIKRMIFLKKEKSTKGLLRYSEIKRAQRIKNTIFQKNQGANIVANLSKRDVLMVGLGLYWGEGYKESNGELGFTNSNIDIIRFYLVWLNIFNVSKKDLIFRLSINQIFKNQEKSIKNFWVKELKIKSIQFTKTTFIKTNLKKAYTKRGNKYGGILRVKVRKGLILKNRILGAIEHIAQNVKI